jgi:hypothetical protein
MNQLPYDSHELVKVTGELGGSVEETVAGCIRLAPNPYRPSTLLYVARDQAQATARQKGAPWVAVAYGCGYLLTDGWHFHDAERLLETFCPVTLPQLDLIRSLVVTLKQEETPSRELPRRIGDELRPLEAELTPGQFESLCMCALMRIGYALPSGAKDDWLTTPAWALRLPSKRPRLQQ